MAPSSLMQPLKEMQSVGLKNSLTTGCPAKHAKAGIG
jgi:hypothetical protein